MHCLPCAEEYGLPTESRVQVARCRICGEQRGCYSSRTKDLRLLLEPREAIKNRIRDINTHLEQLQPFIDQYNSLYQERLRLRDEHLRLEHVLTHVPVKRVKAYLATPPKRPSRRVKDVVRQLTPTEKAKLIAVLRKDIENVKAD